MVNVKTRECWNSPSHHCCSPQRLGQCVFHLCPDQRWPWWIIIDDWYSCFLIELNFYIHILNLRHDRSMMILNAPSVLNIVYVWLAWRFTCTLSHWSNFFTISTLIPAIRIYLLHMTSRVFRPFLGLIFRWLGVSLRGLVTKAPKREMAMVTWTKAVW